MYWLERSEGDVPSGDQWLGPSEQVCLHGLRFAKRRSDWRLGRWTAKVAVAAFLELPVDLESVAHIEIRPAASGAPEIFLRDRKSPLSISLSHRAGKSICVLASCRVDIGCDLELIEPRSEAFVADYFTLNEQALVERTPEQERPLLVTLLWSAKESALKALHLGLRIDTRRLEVSLANLQSPEMERVWRDTALVPLQRSELAGSGVDLDSWRPLQVALRQATVFGGWWRDADHLLRTVVCKR
jgi:4'-phosphopantetheinyl transferase